MNVVLFVNPRSGAGRAASAADHLARQIVRAGHQCQVLTPSDTPAAGRTTIPPGTTALVVLGGDGTLHSVAAAAIDSGAPVYHVPLGTENLFARHYGMRRQPAAVLRALNEGRVTEMDSAMCNGRTFLLMASVGPDASVIQRLAATRSGPITHWSYFKPMLKELAGPPVLPIRVRDEDGRVAAEGPGWLVVANSPHYGLRINPCPDATATDGLLDAAFFPSRSAWATLGWAARCRLLGSTAARGCTRFRAASLTVEALDLPPAMQLDGEPVPGLESGSPVRMSIAPRRLRVLLPASAT